MALEAEEKMQDEKPETIDLCENNTVKVRFDTDIGRTVYQSLRMKEVHRRSLAKMKKVEGKSATAAESKSYKTFSTSSTSIG